MKAGLAVLAAALLVLATSPRSFAAAAAAGAVRGQVVYLEGDVTVDGVPSQIGDPVGHGATVRTGPASLCEIVFGTENVLRIREKTVAALDLTAESLGVRLSSGSVAAVFNKLKTLGGGFRVVTRGAVAGVRGTAFFVQVEDESTTYVCACNGAVAVNGAQGGRETDLVSANHAASRFTYNGSTTTVEKAGLLYHDSALMNAVASRIGYAIPWGGESGYGPPGQGGGR